MIEECKHEFRFLQFIKYKKERLMVFYCIHCLKEMIKWGDMTKKELFKRFKEDHDELWRKKHL